MMHRALFRLVVACILLLSAFAAAAESSDELRARINKGTVGLMSGGVNGTYIRISADLANVLDREDLRVLSILGKGSVQNTADLLYLNGIDLAIVQSDVLEYLLRQGTYPRIRKHIHYVAKLYNEEVHLLVREEIATLEDLTGKRVNMDVIGSGTTMTGSIVFDTLAIPVEPTHYDQATAVERLKRGDISGLVYVAGKPASLFNGLSRDDGLKFLPIDMTPALLRTYLPAKLTHNAYPALISEGESVSTIAVGAVMAVYGWAPSHPRHKKVARFVDEFFGHFDEFLQPARHPKWREVSLSAEVPGWTRFDAAQSWLDHNSPER